MLRFNENIMYIEKEQIGLIIEINNILYIYSALNFRLGRSFLENV